MLFMSTSTKYHFNLPLQENGNENKMELLHEPLILNLNVEQDFSYYKKIYDNAIIVDTIYAQLKELLKNRNPKIKFSDQEYARCIQEHLKNTSIEKYGVWV